MKKKLCMLLLGLCWISLSACGNNASADNLDNISYSSNSKTMDTEAGSDDSEKIKINIEDVAWNVDEGIVNGERYVLLDYTNNTPYTIADFEIMFKEKSDITEDEKSAFYLDIQKMFEATDEEIEELKEYPISMHVRTERVVDVGGTVTNINCCYYTGYYYLMDINHYNLVEPDIITIKYVDDDRIHTVYYDYSSGKYSAETETELAYQWSKTELGNKIPKPDVKILKSDLDIEKTFMFDACGMSFEQFNKYIEECKTIGYIVDVSDFEGFYSADSAEGYNINLYYDEDDYTMSCTVMISDEDTEKESEDERSDNVNLETNKDEDTNTHEQLASGIRPEFKEAMDSYEEFYDEYCDIMKKYAKNPSDLQLLAEYTDVMTKAVEVSEKFKEWEDNELNNEELKYYIEVNSRVTQKLLEVSE